MHCPSLVIGLVLLPLFSTIPVDNEVNGVEVECNPTSIGIQANTRNDFTGHVYVKGHADTPECTKASGENANITGPMAGLTVEFDTCGVNRIRSANPKGIYVSTVIHIQFHPQFQTKVDRVYRVQCFYMEGDKTVSADIQVSDLTTVMQTQNLPMPVCSYEILGGGPTGEPVQYALIGQQVYHQWKCDSETVDTFCMRVHSCTIDDGKGQKFEILTEEGCARDKFVLNNLEYPEDLKAGQEAHVYNFADRPGAFYQCQISITIKEPHAECPRPVCTEPEGFGLVPVGEAANLAEPATEAPEEAAPAGRRGQRRIRREADPGEAIVDVRAELSSLDLPDEGVLESLLRSSKSGKAVDPSHDIITDHLFSLPLTEAPVCVSPIAYTLLLAAACCCTLFLIAAVLYNFRMGPTKYLSQQ